LSHYLRRVLFAVFSLLAPTIIPYFSLPLASAEGIT
jgi:hypothetical protein